MEEKERAIFAWLSRRIVARLPSRRLAPIVVRVSARGLEVRQNGAERLVGWASIDRVTAATAGQVVGDQQIVVIGTQSGDTMAVSEAEPVWRSLMESLHLHLPGAKRAVMWQLELVGGSGQVEVYRR